MCKSLHYTQTGSGADGWRKMTVEKNKAEIIHRRNRSDRRKKYT